MVEAAIARAQFEAPNSRSAALIAADKLLSAAWVPLWYFLLRDNPADSRFVNRAELDHIRTSNQAVPAQPHAVPRSWPEPGVLRHGRGSPRPTSE